MHITPITEELVRGAADLERTERGMLPHRLPGWVRKQFADPQLAAAEAEPAGVRLVFRTRATVVELDTVPTRRVYAGVPPRPGSVYDLVIDGCLVGQEAATGGDTMTVDMATGVVERRSGPVGTVRFDGLPDQAKDVEIWLPHNEVTELVALRTDAAVEPSSIRRRVWLHHGSSISHGSNAASPSTTWPALAAAGGDVELVNLGMGGSALLDPFTARTMRDTPADLVSLKIGINVVNADLMRRRAFVPAVHGFLDTIREGHPTAPLLVLSSIYCPIHEDTPGPGGFDVDALAEGRLLFTATGDPSDRDTGRLTLSIIREELSRIVRQRSADDPNLAYLDGRDLYGAADADELPLPDRLHPDAATHRRMGARFTRLAFGDGGLFASAA